MTHWTVWKGKKVNFKLFDIDGSICTKTIADTRGIVGCFEL